MQNLKIQTLWQLCQELKQKRQDMIEKLGYTQNYLDQQQTLMTSELLSLRQQNNELSSDLTHLYSQLETLRHAMIQRGENGAEAHDSGLETDLQDLRDINAALETELQDLRADFSSLQQAYTELQNQQSAQPDQSAQITQLSQEYAQLETRLGEVQEALDTKETQVNVLLQTVQVIQREFDALRQSNQHLSGDMENLVGQTDQLIGLVETYRQAALAAVTDAGLQDEAEATPAESASEGEEDGDSKAEAVREAVRKKINTVLRHRFGKLPRKLSTSLKEVSSHTRLDKLFDKALKADSIEEFEAGLEA